METEKVQLYYFVAGIGSFPNTSNHIVKPFRIVALTSSITPTGTWGIGYRSIKELRKQDQRWKEYHLKDPDSAVTICKERFVIDIPSTSNLIFTPTDSRFDKVSAKILRHTLLGEERRKEIIGIHLLSGLNPNIKSFKSTAPEDIRGVWKAKVHYHSKSKGKVMPFKESTMFPIYWSPSQFMFEIYTAYENRRQCLNDPNTFHSVTASGVPVDFIIKGGCLKTVYPLYDEG